MAKRILRVVGSGSAIAERERAHAAALVQIPGKPALLMDAGDGIARALALIDCPLSELGGICLTHLHPDHAAGLPGLVQQLRLADLQKPVDLWLPAEARSGFATMMRFFGLNERRLEAVVATHFYEVGTFTCAGLEVHAQRNSHLPSAPDPTLRWSFSLLLAHQGHRLFYSGDLGTMLDLYWPVPAINLAVVDAGHLDPEPAAARALERGAQRVLLTHLHGPGKKRPVDPHIVWARDGLELDW